jgi:putative nucleotidyltransferase with HDIG domain
MASTTYAQTPAALQDAARRIQEISTLPHIALRLMEVANDPNTGARDLKEVMESDATLSARVLRCVNSSAYATRTKITNLQNAIAYLGIQQIRNLAMTASVSKLFARDEMIGSYNRKQLWRHLVSVAICARLVATRLKIRNFEDIFLAGLLHDIGIILEDQHLHKRFVETVQSLAKGTPLVDTERACLGFDHTTLGEEVAKTWNFPELVLTAIRHHHGSVGYKGEHARAVWCVEVANFICSMKGVPSVGANLVQFPRHAINGLSLTKEDVIVLTKDLDREISLNQNLFQM